MNAAVARQIIPIPTEYRGVLFRSRTEARWATLLDLMGIRWEYEAEGYQLQSCWYLPDFWLPQFNAFAEVKGTAEQWDDTATTKYKELALTTGRCVLLLDSFMPDNHHVRAVLPQVDVDEAMQLWVAIPESIRQGRLWFEFDEMCALEDAESGWFSACDYAMNAKFAPKQRSR